jgi:hypothetical protein
VTKYGLPKIFRIRLTYFRYFKYQYQLNNIKNHLREITLQFSLFILTFEK